MQKYETVKQYETHRAELSCGTFIRLEMDGQVHWYGLVGGLVQPAAKWISRENLERVKYPSRNEARQ